MYLVQYWLESREMSRVGKDARTHGLPMGKRGRHKLGQGSSNGESGGIGRREDAYFICRKTDIVKGGQI